MFGWQGMPVTVVGYYQEGAVEAPATVVQQRDGAKVTGTIGEPAGDVVVLDDCRFLE